MGSEPGIYNGIEDRDEKLEKIELLVKELIVQQKAVLEMLKNLKK